jgi:hypothetical protein
MIKQNRQQIGFGFFVDSFVICFRHDFFVKGFCCVFELPLLRNTPKKRDKTKHRGKYDIEVLSTFLEKVFDFLGPVGFVLPAPRRSTRRWGAGAGGRGLGAGGGGLGAGGRGGGLCMAVDLFTAYAAMRHRQAPNPKRQGAVDTYYIYIYATPDARRRVRVRCRRSDCHAPSAQVICSNPVLKAG